MVGAKAREVEIPVGVAESLPFVHVEGHVEPLASGRGPKRNVIGKLEEGSLHSDAVHTQSSIDCIVRISTEAERRSLRARSVEMPPQFRVFDGDSY